MKKALDRDFREIITLQLRRASLSSLAAKGTDYWRLALFWVLKFETVTAFGSLGEPHRAH